MPSREHLENELDPAYWRSISRALAAGAPVVWLDMPAIPGAAELSAAVANRELYRAITVRPKFVYKPHSLPERSAS